MNVKWIHKSVVLHGKIKQTGRCRAVLIVLDIMMVLLLLFYSGKIYKSVMEDELLVDSDRLIRSEMAVNRVGSDNVANQEVKEIALTFDDGPHYAYTKILLDGLMERGVVATFFVTGEHALLHPDLVKRMHDEGHLVGNHTYSHMQLRNNNHKEYEEELILTNQVLKEIIGEEIAFVRPPYGSWDESFEEKMNLIPVLWTVDPLDWCSSSVECIVENTICEVQASDIILMHDYYETSVTAALQIVDMLLEDGFTFVTVEELLFD